MADDRTIPDPDVLLDVPQLRVDEISLEVENLDARVSLDVDVLELLKLHVGVHATLGRVQLTIKGVEAQALLKVRLDNVAAIVDRVLTTIDDNPEIVGRLVDRVADAESLAEGVVHRRPPLPRSDEGERPRRRRPVEPRERHGR